MEIVMPKVGLTMTEGTIAQWHKREGEHVHKGEPLFTFETEKSTLDYESPTEGVLHQILVAEGQTVACLTPVAVIGEAASTLPLDSRLPIRESEVGNRESGVGSRESGIGSGKSGVGRRESALVTTQNVRRRPVSPRARLRARKLGVDLGQVDGTGPDGAIRERDVLAAARSQQRQATPLARRLAEQLGVDLAVVPGSGPQGKITREDVERWALAAGDAAAQRRQVPDAASVQSGAQSPMQPLTPARRIAARRLTASAQQTPHVTLFTEADATHLVAAREQISAELGEKISYNALLVAVCARALKEHPLLNASWVEATEPAIAVHAHIHIGLAVDTPRGLLVPVLKDAMHKSVRQIHQELSDLIARAQNGTLRPDELTGSTFTLTNLGMFEVEGFTPIINPPEAAILGVGRIVRKAVPQNDERIVVRPMITLSLSFDHRVIDGAPAAKGLQRIKQLIERPFALLL